MPERFTEPAYRTIAVTPLPPGWRMLYIEPDGSYYEGHVPAVVIEEHFAWTDYDDKRAISRLQQRPCTPPYNTRVVAATFDDCNKLMPVEDDCVMQKAHPVRMLAPGEDWRPDSGHHDFLMRTPCGWDRCVFRSDGG
jgi:hypothetical protein